MDEQKSDTSQQDVDAEQVEDNKREYVYIATNPVMPDLVKIGVTENLGKRLKDLSSPTSIPVAFEYYYCCEVNDAKKVEKCPAC